MAKKQNNDLLQAAAEIVESEKADSLKIYFEDGSEFFLDDDFNITQAKDSIVPQYSISGPELMTFLGLSQRKCNIIKYADLLTIYAKFKTFADRLAKTTDTNINSSLSFDQLFLGNLLLNIVDKRKLKSRTYGAKPHEIEGLATPKSSGSRPLIPYSPEVKSGNYISVYINKIPESDAKHFIVGVKSLILTPELQLMLKDCGIEYPKNPDINNEETN